MHINPISLYNTQFYPHNKQNKTLKQNKIQIKNLKMPNYAHYVSFCGGSSINLAQSVKNLDSLSVQNGKEEGEKFPPNIHAKALDIIKSGNPEDLTLVDIHKDHYALLNDCYDLDDAKELFDEFKNVLSDKDVEFAKESFGSKVKSGDVENFNKDEDLALQLLKLYWAQGFSLTDLKKYCGVNLHHTMNKLNIPLMDREYAHVLKFSDREYNERLTQEMARKRFESMDRRSQEADGEPVYIARGPLSEQHKKHISEGLVKYYAQHPDKALEKSKRQQEYYENNPEQKELLSKVMLYAWNNTQEGRSIKKHLVKFFAKNKVKIDESVFAGDSDKMTGAQQKLFGQFWKINGWARDKFSIAVKKGWEYNKEIAPKTQMQNFNPNDITQACLLPKSYVRLAIDTFASKGLSSDIIKIMNAYLKDKRSLSKGELVMASLALNEIAKHLSENNSYFADFMVDVQSGAVMSIKNEIQQNTLPKHLLVNKDFINAVYANMCDVFYGFGKTEGTLRTVSGNDISNLMNIVCQLAVFHKEPDFVDYFEQKLDECYNLFLIDEPERSLKLRQFLHVE